MGALDIFGPAPSKKEAMEAVYDLQMISLPTITSQFVGDESNFFSDAAIDRTPLLDEMVKRNSSSGLDRSQVGQQVYKLSSALSQASNKILKALQLLWINPSVKKMVVSLSTDKDVWNAVMKNEMVQEVKRTYHADKYIKHMEYASKRPVAGPGITAQILSWILGIAEAVVRKFIDDIISLVNKLFDQNVVEDSANTVSDLVGTSFLLSVLVFVIVILKRSLIFVP